MRLSWIGLLVLALAFAAPAPARACMPMPPPPQMQGESDAAYQQRLEEHRIAEAAAALAFRAAGERSAWESAQSVLIARVERAGDTVRVDDYFDSPQPTLRPLRWLKGSGSRAPFRVRYREMTSCGPVGGGDAVTGAVGDVFVVFVRSGRPGVRSILGSVALNDIADDQLRALALAQ